MSLSAIPRTLRRHVFERDQGQCQYCHLVQIGQAAVFHINHIVPRSRGGQTVESNLALQCPYCSLHKANKMRDVDPVTGDDVLLFHPRRQRRDEHFSLDASGICHGRTPTGRATVEALRMNDGLPRVARAMQLGLRLLSPSRG